MSEEQLEGKVKWFNGEKGYGFIKVEGLEKDVFLHVKQLRESGITNNLTDGEAVKFMMNDGPRGSFATKIARSNGGTHAVTDTKNKV